MPEKVFLEEISIWKQIVLYGVDGYRPICLRPE